VVANKESGKRQYALTERAVVLCWSKDRIVVIDDDTGQSGAEAHERKGFQRLVADVGMGMAGIVKRADLKALIRDFPRLWKDACTSNLPFLPHTSHLQPQTTQPQRIKWWLDMRMQWMISLPSSKEANMITSTLTSKGQITIPKEIREFLKIKAADQVVFVPLEDGKVLMTSKHTSVTDLFGMLKHRKKKRPVSLQQMENAIRRKRSERGLK
jgi:AbrB family looped-hinge helix DNA binding protein